MLSCCLPLVWMGWFQHIKKNAFIPRYKVVIRVVNSEPEFSISVHILGSVLRYQITHKNIHSMRAEGNRLAADMQCYESVLSSNMQSLLVKLSALICQAVPALVQRASRVHWPGLGLWVDTRAFLHPRGTSTRFQAMASPYEASWSHTLDTPHSIGLL